MERLTGFPVRARSVKYWRAICCCSSVIPIARKFAPTDPRRKDSWTFSGVAFEPVTIIRLYIVSKMVPVDFMFPVPMLETGMPKVSARAANGPELSPAWAAATAELGNWVIIDRPWFCWSRVFIIDWFWMPALDRDSAANIGSSRPPTA